MLNNQPDRGVLFVITGPSGVGKSTLIGYIREQVDQLVFSVSATTRACRPGEVDGQDYHFLNDEAFDALVEENAFLECAEVYGRKYGTLKQPTTQTLEAGNSIVLDIDLRGARQVRENTADAIFIFILPPSIGVLHDRLKHRATDSSDIIRSRMGKVAEQIQGCGEFDYLVVNDQLDEAKSILLGIFKAELARRRVRDKTVTDALVQANVYLPMNDI